MLRPFTFLLALFIWGYTPSLLCAQENTDGVAQALAQGDLYASNKKYDLALDTYHKADKLAHHGGGNAARCAPL